MKHAYADKIRTYAQAEELGLKVYPVVFSHLGAIESKSEKFMQLVRLKVSQTAVREIRNIVTVRLAKAAGLYLRYINLRKKV